jgi:hypothetical protein
MEDMIKCNVFILGLDHELGKGEQYRKTPLRPQVKSDYGQYIR